MTLGFPYGPNPNWSKMMPLAVCPRWDSPKYIWPTFPYLHAPNSEVHDGDHSKVIPRIFFHECQTPGSQEQSQRVIIEQLHQVWSMLAGAGRQEQPAFNRLLVGSSSVGLSKFWMAGAVGSQSAQPHTTPHRNAPSRICHRGHTPILHHAMCPLTTMPHSWCSPTLPYYRQSPRSPNSLSHRFLQSHASCHPAPGGRGQGAETGGGREKQPGDPSNSDEWSSPDYKLTGHRLIP